MVESTVPVVHDALSCAEESAATAVHMLLAAAIAAAATAATAVTAAAAAAAFFAAAHYCCCLPCAGYSCPSAAAAGAGAVTGAAAATDTTDATVHTASPGAKPPGACACHHPKCMCMPYPEASTPQVLDMHCTCMPPPPMWRYMPSPKVHVHAALPGIRPHVHGACHPPKVHLHAAPPSLSCGSLPSASPHHADLRRHAELRAARHARVRRNSHQQQGEGTVAGCRAACSVFCAARSHVDVDFMFSRWCMLPDMLATCCPWLHALPDAVPNACMHMVAWALVAGPHLERSPDCDRPCSLGLGRWRGNLGRCLLRSFHGRCCFDSPVVNRTIVSRRCFDPLPSASARALQGTRMRRGVGELGSACRAVVDAGSLPAFD